MNGIDFSELSDDQLVGLIRAACAEAVCRGAGVASAARDAYVTEVDRARVVREATSQEAERLRKLEEERIAADAAAAVRLAAEREKAATAAEREATLWARRRGIALALQASSYDPTGDQVVVWRSGSHEKRVFLQERAYGGRTYATLYVTGNAKHAPDSVQFTAGLTARQKTDVAAILRAVAAEWDAMKVDVSEALAWKGTAIPLRGYEAAVTQGEVAA